ncbi:MAG: glycoside hydrolase family 9 protein, partial [Verrucomicrobiales bacterium]|nr:glycoside hydrolase family 9 protein [Verrucomicrobiales bacterium]
MLLPLPGRAQNHNYSEAFQKALYFYEAQISGAVGTNNRCEFRADSAMRDGSDVGRDLTGGWYDAGDGVVWTINDAFGASLVAWSVVKYRDVYIGTAQYEIVMDRLREITDYFYKIVQTNGSGQIERIYCGKGALAHNPPLDPAPTNDRTIACPHEVIDTPVGGVPQSYRPSYWVDATTGGADVAGMLAAALAASSVAFREYGDTNRAEFTLNLARRVFHWGDTNRNATLNTRRVTNGVPVTISSYPTRSTNYWSRLIYGAAWLHRAELAAGTPGYTAQWVDKAEQLYNEPAYGSKNKGWAHFMVAQPFNGAYAMMAADTGRQPFVSEANSYANYWLYTRANETGLSTDITNTPAGFVCRGDGGWNINYLVDQAPPLLDWADSPYNTNTLQKTNLNLLFTGTYSNKCLVRQIDYILGDNPYSMSYLQGYAKPGYSWVSNLHYRTTWFRYGGLGTPMSDQPLWNTYVTYGLLAPGPDPTDYYPATRPLTNGTTIKYQEPIVYSGGILTVLARNIRLGGTNVGSVLSTFPPWIERGADYQTRHFFVEAYSQLSGTRLQCFVNNRASLPPREINTLGFRYYFTPDGVPGTNVSCSAVGINLLAGESVSVAGPFQVGSGTNWYFEIKLNNAYIVPGENNAYRRQVQLTFSQPSGSFSLANDHSGKTITTSQARIPNIPVYDTSGGTWKWLGGFEPGAGYIQWRRAHFNNVLERASNVVLIAERVGGTNGAVSATLITSNGTATNGVDFLAPTGSAAILNWAAGESGEKTISIPLVQDDYDERREFFMATLDQFTGGA